MSSRTSSSALLFVVVLAIGRPAGAQEVRAARVARARALFEEGEAAAGEGRTVEAARLFRESLAEVRRASTAYNLALMLRDLGRLREAETLLEGVDGDEGADADVRARAGSRLREIREAIPRLEVTVTPAEAVLRLDGVVVDERVLRVDPGHHALSAHHLDQSEERELRLAPGTRRVIRLEVPVVAPEGDVLAEPWFWFVIAGAALVAGGAVALGVVLGTEDDSWGRAEIPLGTW